MDTDEAIILKFICNILKFRTLEPFLFVFRLFVLALRAVPCEGSCPERILSMLCDNWINCVSQRSQFTELRIQWIYFLVVDLISFFCYARD